MITIKKVTITTTTTDRFWYRSHGGPLWTLHSYDYALDGNQLCDVTLSLLFFGGSDLSLCIDFLVLVISYLNITSHVYIFIIHCLCTFPSLFLRFHGSSPSLGSSTNELWDDRYPLTHISNIYLHLMLYSIDIYLHALWLFNISLFEILDNNTRGVMF